MIKETMRSTRLLVLQNLRKMGQATASQLADQVGVKTVNVRHHLNALQAEGLVSMEEERQQVGRLRHVYRLTQKAHDLFPQKYHRLVELLLAQIKKDFPPEMVEALINSLADEMADEMRAEFEDLPQEERMVHLIEVLTQEGFLAKWQQTDDGLQLVKYHCPYYRVSQHHPEVCQIGEVLIQVAMNADVEKEACVLTGDSVYRFVLQDGS